MKKILLALLSITLFLTTFSFAAELLFLSDFETGNVQCPSCNPDGWVEQSCYDYSIEPVTSPVRAGNYAIKVFLSQNDSYSCWSPSGSEPYPRARAQIYKDDPAGTQLTYRVGNWLGFSQYIPIDFPATAEVSIFSYWKNMAYKIYSDGTADWRRKWGTGAGTDPDGTASLDRRTYTKGEWVDWIIYYYPSWESDGITKIWRNGSLIVNFSGPNCVQGAMGWSPPVFKLYRWNWLWTPTPYDELVIYFDEIRMADGPDTQEYRDLVDPAQGGGSSNTAPTVTSQAATDITHSTTTGHGTITATGGVNATKRGICWNTTGSPTVASDKVEESGSFGIGAFTGNLTSLTPDLRYFAKAYAMNTVGYGYGSQVTFDTVESGTYIIDNGDTGTSSTGNWYVSGGANPYGIDSLTCSETNSTYTFEKTLDGEYTVSLWWTYWSSRSDNITVRVYDSGDNLLATENINQQLYGGQWNELDTYDFNATAKVVITSTGGSPTTSTCADAIRFVLNEGIIRQFMMMMGM